MFRKRRGQLDLGGYLGPVHILDGGLSHNHIASERRHQVKGGLHVPGFWRQDPNPVE